MPLDMFSSGLDGIALGLKTVGGEVAVCSYAIPTGENSVPTTATTSGTPAARAMRSMPSSRFHRLSAHRAADGHSAPSPRRALHLEEQSDEWCALDR